MYHGDRQSRIINLEDMTSQRFQSHLCANREDCGREQYPCDYAEHGAIVVRGNSLSKEKHVHGLQ